MPVCLPLYNDFHTSGKKMRKKICTLLVATFLENHRKNKLLQVFLWGKWGAYTEASFSKHMHTNCELNIFENNSSQHMDLYKKQH